MIKRIEALNYRALKYISQDLKPFQILVGPNASGKSTFLDVVALLGDYVQHGLDDALLFGFEGNRGRASHLDELIFNQAADGFELAIELAIPEHLQKANTNGKKNAHSDLARYEVAFGKDENGELKIKGETLWLISTKNKLRDRSLENSLYGILDESSPVTLMNTIKSPEGYKPVVKKIIKTGNNYFKAENTNWNMSFHSGTYKAALASLPEDEERFPIAIWVRNLLLDSIKVLALNSVAMRRPVSPSFPRKFSVDGANLPLVIRELKRVDDVAYQDWVDHVQTILDDVEDIEIVERPEDRHLYLAIKYRDVATLVPSWLVSDGTLRLLALTLLAYLPDESSIYLIEEPENGIHPKAVEGVFESLSSMYRGQVLVATHSPLFLGLAKAGDLLCFAKNPSGAIDVVNGDKHPALQNWQGQIDLSTLYAAGVLG